MRFLRTALLVGMLFGAAWAQSDISVLNFPRVNLAAVIILGSIIILIIGGFVVYEISRRRRQVKDETKVAHSIFEINAQRVGLTDEEATRLYHIAESAQVPQINDVFEQIAVFERSIDKEVTSFLSRGIRPETRLLEEKILSEIRKKLKFNFLELEHPLVSTRNISPGQIVAIYTKNSRQPLIPRARVTRNHEFYCALEFDPKMSLLVAPGEMIRIAFTRQNDGVYGIEVPVAMAVSGVIEVSHTLELKRHQMRKDVRLEVNLPLRFRVIRPIDAVHTQSLGEQPFSAKIADISGGGLSFISEKAQKSGDILSLSFSAGEQSLMNGLKAKVLRIGRQKSEKELYRHHVQFIEIEEPQREKIIKYIFEKQHQINQWR